MSITLHNSFLFQLLLMDEVKVILKRTTRKRRLPKRDEHQTTTPWHPVVISMVLAVAETTAIRLMGQLLRGCSSMENNNRPRMGICAAVCGCNFALMHRRLKAKFYHLKFKAYLTLLNRGWRRSGNLLYLPSNWSSCCATTCILTRLERTPKFRISKSQKKMLKRIQKELAGNLNGCDL